MAFKTEGALEDSIVTDVADVNFLSFFPSFHMVWFQFKIVIFERAVFGRNRRGCSVS